MILFDIIFSLIEALGAIIVFLFSSVFEIIAFIFNVVTGLIGAALEILVLCLEGIFRLPEACFWLCEKVGQVAVWIGQSFVKIYKSISLFFKKRRSAMPGVVAADAVRYCDCDDCQSDWIGAQGCGDPGCDHCLRVKAHQEKPLVIRPGYTPPHLMTPEDLERYRKQAEVEAQKMAAKFFKENCNLPVDFVSKRVSKKYSIELPVDKLKELKKEAIKSMPKIDTGFSNEDREQLMGLIVSTPLQQNPS